MLGQPVSMLIPRVVGFKLTGDLPEGATATDLVLTITEMLRKHGVVGKFVEFYGPGVVGAAAGQPGHHRQHEPGVRLHHRGLPDRRGDDQVPQAHRPHRGAARAGRGLRQGAGPLARPGRRAALLREARARPGDRRPVARRPEAPAGPGLARPTPRRPSAARWPTTSTAATTQDARGTTRRSPSPSRPATRRSQRPTATASRRTTPSRGPDGRRPPEQPGPGRRSTTARSSRSTTARSRSRRSRRAPTPPTRR